MPWAKLRSLGGGKVGEVLMDVVLAVGQFPGASKLHVSRRDVGGS